MNLTLGGKDLQAISEAFELNENQLKINPLSNAIQSDPKQPQHFAKHVQKQESASMGSCSKRQHSDCRRKINFPLKQVNRKMSR